ncbi:MAG TPA: polysaccharide deacetylase family protein [Ureibacillus sp.]|nr:polysaccharide deacetylase family protein [Ureibacillus sp.]
MLKKIKKMLVPVISSFVFLGIISQSGSASAATNSNTYAVPLHDNVAVYDNSTGQSNEVATIKANQPVVITRDFDANLWEVKIGNGYGYINKSDVSLSTTLKTNNLNQGKANKNSTVLIHSDAPVYDNTSGKLVPMATIKEGIRYPIVADYGKNWWLVDIGGRLGYLPKFKTTIDHGIPILMYHHILKPEEKRNSEFANASTTVTTVEFEEQMKWLYENGYKTISMEDLERYLNRGGNVPSKSVVITFDDGIVSTREYAYPVLKQYGFIAEQFIITSRTQATPVEFNWKGLQFLSTIDMENLKDVFRYGSHTNALHNIVNGVSLVVSEPEHVVYSDLKLSKEALNTNYFAYPFGQYNNQTIKIVKSLGFTMAVTTKNGKVHLGDDKLQLKRMGIEPGMNINQFANEVSN